MRSIKFTEAEIEFLQGQYELELIEAEKYIGEIKNILKKLGSISDHVAEAGSPAKKKGRGRPPKSTGNMKTEPLHEGPIETGKKKKGKRGRPKKRGRKKGSKRLSANTAILAEPKTAEVKIPALKPLVKKAVKKEKSAKPVLKKAEKVIPAKIPVVAGNKAAAKKTGKEQPVKEVKKAKLSPKKLVKKKAASKKKQLKPVSKAEAQAVIIPPPTPAEQESNPTNEVK